MRRPRAASSALTMPAARELAQFGIRVIAIAPGIFRHADAAGAAARRRRRASPPRCRSPSGWASRTQYAALVRHMIENRYLNGEVDPPRRRAAHGAALSRMLTNTRNHRIEWGDCDPAGIVFYPRYFAMFDTSTTVLSSARSA